MTIWKEEKKRIEEEEKKRIEEKEKKRKEEEEKKRIEEEEKKRKEEERKEKEKKENEEKERKDKEKKEKVDQRQKEEQKPKKEIKEKQEEIQKNNELKAQEQDNILDGIIDLYKFNKNIQNQLSEVNQSFLLECSVIDKKWYEKFIENSNFNILKEKMDKLKFKNVEDEKEVKETIKNTINFDKLETLYHHNNKEEDSSKALDNIENLAFVSEKFLNQINAFTNKNKKQNPKNNEPNKKQMMIKNGQALLKMNDQKYVCFNPDQGNINNQKNNELYEFPKDEKVDLFKIIENDKKNEGLKCIVNNERNKAYSRKVKPIAPPKPQKPSEPPKKPRIKIEKDSSLGLDNVGATCYMNATIQCLAHIKRVSNHIINSRENGELKDTKKYQLTSVYADVLKGIWFPENNAKSFAPNKFKKTIGIMNPLFAPTAANDAKDLLIFLIEQMHNELNKSKEKNMCLIMPDDMDPTNQQQVLECFGVEFMKKYDSIFSHCFYGSNVSMTCCFGCNIIKYSYQCFSFMIFPLLEAKKYCVQSGKIPQMMYNQYMLNIEDCFIYNQKLEFFSGDNQMYCNTCRSLMNSSMCTLVYTAPLVLILVLNRGRGNLDFQEKFQFWEIIDLTNYVQYKQPDNRYFLTGIITHLGESGAGGHFIAFCRMSENSPWFCYNDSIVTQTNFIDINNRGTPYILFYQKIIME